MDWIVILGKVSIWIILLPLMIGFLALNKLDKDSKLILLIVLLGTVPQVLNPFYKNTASLNFIYNLYTLFEFFIYWYLYYINIQGNNFKRIASAILISFIAISFYLVLKNNMFNSFITVWVIVSNSFQLILAGLCLLTFFYFDDLDLPKSRPLFWFLIGSILYAACTIIFFSLWDYLKRNSNTSISFLNIVHHIFNIGLYLFFTWGFVLNLRKDKLGVVYE